METFEKRGTLGGGSEKERVSGSGDKGLEVGNEVWIERSQEEGNLAGLQTVGRRGH